MARAQISDVGERFRRPRLLNAPRIALSQSTHHAPFGMSQADTNMDHRLPATGRAQRFPLLTTRRIIRLSMKASDNARRSRAFSCPGSFRRLAWPDLLAAVFLAPPEERLLDYTPGRQISAMVRPRADSTSASRSLGRISSER